MHIPHSISQGVGRCVLSSVVTNYPRPLTHHFWTTYLKGHGLVVKNLQKTLGRRKTLEEKAQLVVPRQRGKHMQYFLPGVCTPGSIVVKRLVVKGGMIFQLPTSGLAWYLDLFRAALNGQKQRTIWQNAQHSSFWIHTLPKFSFAWKRSTSSSRTVDEPFTCPEKKHILSLLNSSFKL